MLGLDFGTTNSAVGVGEPGGSSRLASFGGPEAGAITFRSVLHFSALDRVPHRRPLPTAGPEAIAIYLDEGAGGRFLQSLKSHLASRHLNETYVFGWKFTLEDLLYEAVERTKLALSAQDAARFEFRELPRLIRQDVARADFEGWVAGDIARLAGCVDRLLERCGVGAADVDRVFLTGGSSLVPCVRELFMSRFGAGRLRGGEELTTVARGLALIAAERG